MTGFMNAPMPEAGMKPEEVQKKVDDANTPALDFDLGDMKLNFDLGSMDLDCWLAMDDYGGAGDFI